MTADGRFDYLKRSYQCFCDQTYPNLELLIVTDGGSEYKKKIKELIDRDNVRLVFLDQIYSLGALRNISVALSSGDIFVQWDDDDFNAPDRVLVQYSFLYRHPDRLVSYLTDQLHYFFPTNRLYWNHWGRYCNGGSDKYSLIPGTIMARKDGFYFKYPSSGEFCSAGEDSILSNRICEKEKVLLVKDVGFLHVYSYHGKNVYDLEHHENISKFRGLSAKEILKYRDRLVQSLDYFDFDDKIEIMGKDDLAFVYRSKNV